MACPKCNAALLTVDMRENAQRPSRWPSSERIASSLDSNRVMHAGVPLA